MVKKKNALGRGLEALLADSSVENLSGVSEIEIDLIEVNPYQPRMDFDEESLRELAESIEVQGIIQPITVRRVNKKYQLISGERRLQASKLIGLKKIPAYIKEVSSDQQMLELALIENIQRENLNAIEIALSYQRLITECELKQEELGDRVGKKRTTVNNYLRLLKLPPDIQIALRDQQITMGHARALINVPHVDDQLKIFKRIVKENLSVRKVEELARNLLKQTQSKSKDKTIKSFEYQKLEENLSSHFGTKITISIHKNNKGEIKIPYHSIEDLNRLLEIINGE